MNGLQALVLSKNYVNKSLNGLGVLKGAACTIKNVEEITDVGIFITFEWEGKNGQKEEQLIMIPVGISIVKVELDDRQHLMCYKSDGSVEDAGLVRYTAIGDVELQYASNADIDKLFEKTYVLPTGTVITFNNILDMSDYSSNKQYTIAYTTNGENIVDCYEMDIYPSGLGSVMYKGKSPSGTTKQLSVYVTQFQPEDASTYWYYPDCQTIRITADYSGDLINWLLKNSDLTKDKLQEVFK